MKKLSNHPREPFRPGAVLLVGASLAFASLLSAQTVDPTLKPVPKSVPIGTILGTARNFTAFAASTNGKDFQFNKSIVRGTMGFGPRIKPTIGDGSQLLGDCAYDLGLTRNPCSLITSHTGNDISANLAPVVQDINDAAVFVVRTQPPTRLIKGDLTAATKPAISAPKPANLPDSAWRGSVNVIRVTGKIKSSAPITITGGPTDYFLFNVNGPFECSKNQIIQLQGGVTPANILFVHGDRVNASGGCGWSGTTIVTKAGTDNTVNNSAIRGGAILIPDGKLSVVSNASITWEPFTVYDYGDAPDSYGTTYYNQGARHAFSTQGPRLGTKLDAETDGQPTVGADGDDKWGYGPGDEDGIDPSKLQFTQGLPAWIDVTVNNPGPAVATLACWIDFYGTGTFTAASVTVGRTVLVAAGTVPVNFGTVPANIPATTYLRCRISTDPNFISNPQPLGTAADGEVEDYQVHIGPPRLDWGDAPDSYHTLRANRGPSHILLGGLVLGKIVDAEADGQPEETAKGDDKAPVEGPDDEDGIDSMTVLSLDTFNHTLTVPVSVTNSLSQSATLACWIDFNNNGQFDDSEMATVTVPPGTKPENGVAVPFANISSRVSEGSYFGRCRIGTRLPVTANGRPSPLDQAPDGEVEDHYLNITPVFPLTDHGDAPESYGTTESTNGPAHVVSSPPVLMLGQRVDAEPAGIPSDDAKGDDNDGSQPSDEDGIDAATITGDTSVFTQGQDATLTVFVTNKLADKQARLVCWVDFDSDGKFGTDPEVPTDSPEKSAASVPPGYVGPIPLTFSVPNYNRSDYLTYLRCRIATIPDLAIPIVEQPYGIADDGEVEDYQVTIKAPL